MPGFILEQTVHQGGDGIAVSTRAGGLHEVSETADVVIVGGGVIGTSTAYNLARRGAGRVVLLERDGVAAHASSLSAGLVRTHYSNAPEARLALAGLRWFENWNELVGGDCGFVRTGLANLVASHDHDRLRQNVRTLQDVGVDTALVGPEELVELEPDMRVAEDELAAYEPRSGYADPGRTTRGLAAAASREGADVREGVAVTALLSDGERITGVETTTGFISAPVVVLANGAWSVSLARQVGVEIPIQSVAVRLAFVRRPEAMRGGQDGHLVVLDRAFGAYTRPEGEASSMIGLAGFRQPMGDPDGYRLARDRAFEVLARRQVSMRFPSFGHAPFESERSGPIDLTPDLCAIIDRLQPDGLFVAVGMSGSGFKKGPAIGECLAEMIVEGKARTAPIDDFRLARFHEGPGIVSNGYTVAPEAADVLGGASLVH